MMVFLSIIIPFNREERYLKDCLDSLSQQNLTDSEIILIVNGYDGNIDDFLKDYSNLNIITKSFDNEINVGKARNEGLRIAQGEYVYFIDSDDYLHENGLDKLTDVALKSNADFINGERINTSFIRDRFNEHRAVVNEKFLLKEDRTDIQYSFQLLVGTKTNKLEILSALHSLIKRDIIENVFFDEDIRYLSDYGFILEAVKNAKTFIGVENAIYAKRSHDDPYNYPSLNQEEKEDGFLMYCQAYENSLNYINQFDGEKFKELKFYLSKKLLNYYVRKFANRFYASQNDQWRNEYYDAMQKISKDFDATGRGYLVKKEVNALQNNDRNALMKYIKIRARKNWLKKILRKRWKFRTAIYKKYYNERPIQENKIVFASFLGKYYADSPKYLYEYLYKNFGDEFEFVWILNNTNVKIPGNPKIVKRFSFEFYREMATAKYWVTNNRQAKRLKKREEQIIVSTWHGTPLKKLGLDIGNIHTRNPRLKKEYIKVGRTWDYLISPNRYTTDILKSAFAYEGEILECGYPRNDLLYNATDEDIIKIKDNLNIPDNKKIILYAPTWRDDEYVDVGQVNFELKLDLARLQQEVGDEYIILVRTHYFIANQLDLSPYKGFAFDVCDYDDIAELYLISDILITDYSSVFFDYANLKRPILFFTYDLEKYENVLRGFYIDIHSEVPGPLLKTNDELIESIKNIDEIEKEYSEKYEEFYKRFCSIDDGDASKRIVKRIWGK